MDNAGVHFLPIVASSATHSIGLQRPGNAFARDRFNVTGRVTDDEDTLAGDARQAARQRRRATPALRLKSADGLQMRVLQRPFDSCGNSAGMLRKIGRERSGNVEPPVFKAHQAHISTGTERHVQTAADIPVGCIFNNCAGAEVRIRAQAPFKSVDVFQRISRQTVGHDDNWRTTVTGIPSACQHNLPLLRFDRSYKRRGFGQELRACCNGALNERSIQNSAGESDTVGQRERRSGVLIRHVHVLKAHGAGALNEIAQPARGYCASAAPFKQHPQTLSRGKGAFSTSRTALPRRANSYAASAPAGPAPITMTLHVRRHASSSVNVAAQPPTNPVSVMDATTPGDNGTASIPQRGSRGDRPARPNRALRRAYRRRIPNADRRCEPRAKTKATVFPRRPAQNPAWLRSRSLTSTSRVAARAILPEQFNAAGSGSQVVQKERTEDDIEVLGAIHL